MGALCPHHHVRRRSAAAQAPVGGRVRNRVGHHPFLRGKSEEKGSAGGVSGGRGEGTEDVGPVAVSGGNPAEEIARSMEVERTVCITNEDEDICAPAETMFSTEEEEA